MTARLTGVRGPLTGRTFDLSDYPLTIGRAADNHIAIASPRASRHHAHIRREGAAFVLYDLGSGNGTLVNGQRVQRAVLHPGDLIEIGDEVFRFEAAHQQDATVLGAPAAAPPYPSQPPASQPPYPSAAYPPPTAPPYQTPLGNQSPAYPPPQPAYPPQAPAAYPPQPYAMYAPMPPPRKRGCGCSTCLLVMLLLILVIGAGAAGAFFFRDQVRNLPAVGDLPIIVGDLPTMTRAPMQNNSATVGSGQAAAISMPGGLMIEVPVGAVPSSPDGSPGTLTFSVAPAPAQPVNLPPDFALSGLLYQFEPGGVTFAVPVRITLPIPAETDPAQVMGLITRDPQSGAWVPIGGVVDSAARTVSAEVTHFSPYGVYSYTGSNPAAWQRANGGWFILENRTFRGERKFPGCRDLPRALYVNVCLQNALPDNPTTGSWMASNKNFAIGPRYDTTAAYQPLKVSLPSGTYTVVHYVFMSEINNDPLYAPCYGWWVKPPQTVRLTPGATITFYPFGEETGQRMIAFDPRTCTGVPAPDARPCPTTLNGVWTTEARLVSTTIPGLQEEFGQTDTATVGVHVTGNDVVLRFVESGTSVDFARGTCVAQPDRYLINAQLLTPEELPIGAMLVFKMRPYGNDRMSGVLTIEVYGQPAATVELLMNRR